MRKMIAQGESPEQFSCKSSMLEIIGNKLVELNLSNNGKLANLNCMDNKLTSLDVSDCPEDLDIMKDDGVTVIR